MQRTDSSLKLSLQNHHFPCTLKCTMNKNLQVCSLVINVTQWRCQALIILFSFLGRNNHLAGSHASYPALNKVKEPFESYADMNLVMCALEIRLLRIFYPVVHRSGFNELANKCYGMVVCARKALIRDLCRSLKNYTE